MSESKQPDQSSSGSVLSKAHLQAAIEILKAKAGEPPELVLPSPLHTLVTKQNLATGQFLEELMAYTGKHTPNKIAVGKQALSNKDLANGAEPEPMEVSYPIMPRALSVRVNKLVGTGQVEFLFRVELFNTDSKIESVCVLNVEDIENGLWEPMFKSMMSMFQSFMAANIKKWSKV